MIYLLAPWIFAGMNLLTFFRLAYAVGRWCIGNLFPLPHQAWHHHRPSARAVSASLRRRLHFLALLRVFFGFTRSRII